MIKYICKRLLVAIPTFLGITIITYYMSTLAGSPLEMLLNNPEMTQEILDLKARELGLDQPVFIQYFRWLLNLLSGNLGYSTRTGATVISMLAQRIGPTLILTITSMIIAVIISIPLGVMAAYKRNSLWDYGSSGLSFLGASVPNFFLGLILIYTFSVQFHLLPMNGMYTVNQEKTLGDLLIHLLMPAITLAFGQAGSLIRHVRSSMLEVLNEDYIRTARAKGLKEKVVIMLHGLRNGAIPICTQLGMSIPFLVGGAVVTEKVFGWPGIGTLMILSINSRDYPVIMGITIVVSGAVLLGNLLTDIVYGLLDPRIRYN